MVLLKKYGPYALALVLILWLGISCYQRGKAVERSKQSALALAQAKDSLAQLKTLLSSQATVDTHVIARVDTLWKTRIVTIAVADTFGHRADSIIHLLPDTGEVCRALRTAYDYRTSECAELRKTVQADSEAIQRGQVALRENLATLAHANTTILGLQDRLKIVSKPFQCRFLLLFSCPSRTLSFVLGAVVVEGARLSLTRHF